MFRTITIELNEGLANRMRVIASAFEFCKMHNYKLKIVWLNNQLLNCDFEEIFERIPEIEFVKPINKKLFNSIQNNGLKKLISKVFNQLNGYNFVLMRNDKTIHLLNNQNNLPNLIKKSNIVYLESCYPIYHTHNYAIFKPISSIVNSINYTKTQFTISTIGLHVRRGDNLKSIYNSSIKLFINIIKKELIYLPSVKFYLSTDSQDILDCLVEMFGENTIITRSKDYSRDSTKGIQDALTDLYLLSNCCRIYGSYWSSFSETAAFLGNIPLIVLKNE
jgi:hypothetical protein